MEVLDDGVLFVTERVNPYVFLVGVLSSLGKYVDIDFVRFDFEGERRDGDPNSTFSRASASVKVCTCEFTVRAHSFNASSSDKKAHGYNDPRDDLMTTDARVCVVQKQDHGYGVSVYQQRTGVASLILPAVVCLYVDTRAYVRIGSIFWKYNLENSEEVLTGVLSLKQWRGRVRIVTALQLYQSCQSAGDGQGGGAMCICMNGNEIISECTLVDANSGIGNVWVRGKIMDGPERGMVQVTDVADGLVSCRLRRGYWPRAAGNPRELVPAARDGDAPRSTSHTSPATMSATPLAPSVTGHPFPGKHVSGRIEPVYGSVLDLPNLQACVLVDPAGTAFDGSGTFDGAGFSGEIYSRCHIKGRPMKGHAHNMTLEVGGAILNRDVDEVLAVIHAIGPKYQNRACDVNYFQTLVNTFKSIRSQLTQIHNATCVALPLISSSRFKPSNFDVYKYMQFYIIMINTYLPEYVVYLNLFGRTDQNVFRRALEYVNRNPSVSNLSSLAYFC
jgi:hypothetical protein